MCTSDDRLIRFDWAMKRMLRDKANFGVLEGFLTSLLGKPIYIETILESESNRDSDEQKLNRVDILAQTTEKEKMLIEVQNQSEIDYFHRMLFGTTRLISDYTRLGERYGKITKIYSINIVYFRLGEGEDSVYVGTTDFYGLHDGSQLRLSPRWRERLEVDSVSDIFPTYYILRVNDFDKWSKTPLDQWLYFLSNSRVPEDADAPGLKEVREKLRLDRLPAAERLSYLKLIDDRISIMNSIEDARYEGHAEGRAEGREEGREEAILEKALIAKEAGLSDEMIFVIFGIKLSGFK
ncbi:MAG: hypothetical protein HDS13_06675 [Bacteroides sp.]|nr:hypothetical protein [Bacteroides sp.]